MPTAAPEPKEVVGLGSARCKYLRSTIVAASAAYIQLAVGERWVFAVGNGHRSLARTGVAIGYCYGVAAAGKPGHRLICLTIRPFVGVGHSPT